MTSVPSMQGKWVTRFIWAAIVQGVAAVGWTLFIINPYSKPAPTMVLAEGSAGSWLTLGYVLYLVLGVVAVAVTAVFYFYIETIRGKMYTGFSNYFAWGHLVLMNVGVAAATWLLMYAGYLGGAGLLPASEGGGGLTAGQVHTTILQFYVNPIAYIVLVAAIGVVLGGLGYVLRLRMK